MSGTYRSNSASTMAPALASSLTSPRVSMDTSPDQATGAFRRMSPEVSVRLMLPAARAATPPLPAAALSMRASTSPLPPSICTFAPKMREDAAVPCTPPSDKILTSKAWVRSAPVASLPAASNWPSRENWAATIWPTFRAAPSSLPLICSTRIAPVA